MLNTIRFALYTSALYLAFIVLIYLVLFAGLYEVIKAHIGNFGLVGWLDVTVKYDKFIMILQYVVTCIVTFLFCVWMFLLHHFKHTFFTKISLKLLLTLVGVDVLMVSASCFVEKPQLWVFGLLIINLITFLYLFLLPFSKKHAHV
jgi:hypothetical protein